jgi:hypothetical protein
VSRIEFISGIDNTNKDDGYITFSTSEGALSEKVRIAQDGKMGIGTSTPKSTLQVVGGIQLSDDTDAASAQKVGTLRYRTESGTPNKSFLEMCMQTGVGMYEWVIIKENSW